MVSTTMTVLPPASTALERAIDQGMPAWDGLAEAMTPTGPRVVDAYPVAFYPWLAAEWGLADFARYFDSLADLLEAGRPWLLERGCAPRAGLAGLRPGADRGRRRLPAHRPGPGRQPRRAE